MSSILVRPRFRRSLRRWVRWHCQAVALEDFRLIGDQVLDLSPRGALVACDDGVEVGEEMIVTLKTPAGGPWLDAEAEVARVIEGWRPGDPGYAAGLRFTRFTRAEQNELIARLAGCPPPAPRRRIPVDYAETVRRIWTVA